MQDVRPLATSKNGSMVGEAFTLRYIPAREDLNPMTVFRDHSHPQRRAVEECPPGCVLVIDSRKDPRAASAGGILATRLMVRGVAGMVTDGGFCDSSSRSRHWKCRRIITARRPPTNLTLHQAIDLNVPIGCGDAPVFPGDIVVGDVDGVIIIPSAIADEIAEEAVEMTADQDFVIERVREGKNNFWPVSRDGRGEPSRIRILAKLLPSLTRPRWPHYDRCTVALSKQRSGKAERRKGSSAGALLAGDERTFSNYGLIKMDGVLLNNDGLVLP